ncbi:MAG: TIR domain-containing protein [Candidatus Bipolaricaulia bacterium]
MSTYDLFLSYHSPDRKSIQTVRQLLEARGIATFLDRENLVAGLPWPQALEEALRSARAVAVFLGPHDLGLWQKREIGFALDRQVQEEKAGRVFPVIPVLLPGADLTSGFLFLNTWVDLHQDLTDSEALDALVRAVRGKEAVRPEEVRVALCPYRGLRAFGEEHAAFFFGQEEFSKRLLKATLNRNLVAVVGPSGSGKSSVVQAGLLPLLRRQRPPAATWDAVLFTPGDRPFHRLAAALISLLEPSLNETDRLTEARKLGKRLANGETLLEDAVERLLEKSEGTDRLLLVADQFEELFTLTPKTDRKSFVTALLNALERAPLSVLLTLRADFYGNALALTRDLSDRLEGGVVNLGSMKRDELERAIVDPAQKVGLTFEPGLVDRILDDVGDNPGNLPLLEFALTELWAQRQGGMLTHAAYEDIGEVAGAIAQRAEAEFAKFTPEQRKATRRVFTRLVRVAQPEEGSEDTRRRATLVELGEEARSVIKTLADARLLVTGRDGVTEEEKVGVAREVFGKETVEVVHEALVRGWKQLQSWLDEDREFLLWRQRLRAALTEWERTERDEGALLRGASLAEAERWLTERPDDLNPDEQGYTQESLALRKQERAARERLRRRVILGLTLGLLAALILGGVAGLQWRRAEEQRRIAEEQRQVAEEQLARQLAAQAEFVRVQQADLLPRSVLLVVESLRRVPTLEGDQALRHSLALLSRPVAQMAHESWVFAVAFSPDGSQLATGSVDGTARVWEAESGRQIARMTHQGGVSAVAFNSDSHWVTSASWDGTVRVWEAESGHEIARMTHDGPVVTVTFSPDGRWLASGSNDNTAQVWEAETGRQIARMPHDGPVRTVVFSPDGRWLASGSRDGTARVWEAETGRELARMTHNGDVNAVTFSPSGQWIASASEDGTARVWEAETGRQIARMPHDGPVLEVAFSPGGQWIASASEDGTTRVWETETGRQVARMTHEGPVSAVAFSPDGQWIASASGDRTARVWETETGRQIARMTHEGLVSAVTFSPDGQWIASASEDRTARVWEATAGRHVVRTMHEGRVSVIAFSPDGRWLASGGDDNTARVWEATAGRQIARMPHEDPVNAVAFSPDGRWLASGGDDNTAHVWEATVGRQIARMPHEDPVNAVAFSPDGRWLASASDDGTARVWETESSREIARMTHKDRVNAVVFSPDGQWIASASRDGTAHVWEAESGRQVAQMMHESERQVVAVTFSPDGRWLASASWDGTARVWEAESGRQIARMMHDDLVSAVAFSPDGRRLASASWDGTARVWEATTGRELARMMHDGRVSAVTFSPDGRQLATGSVDGTARVWEAETGREVARMFHDGPVSAVAFSPDGRRLASASWDGTARVWLWQPEDLIAEACSRLTHNLTLDEWQQYLGDEPYRKTCPNLPEPEEGGIP